VKEDEGERDEGRRERTRRDEERRGSTREDEERRGRTREDEERRGSTREDRKREGTNEEQRYCKGTVLVKRILPLFDAPDDVRLFPGKKKIRNRFFGGTAPRILLRETFSELGNRFPIYFSNILKF
jgi:hypothetical protein